MDFEIFHDQGTGYYEFWEGVIPPVRERYHYRFYVEGAKKLCIWERRECLWMRQYAAIAFP